MKRILLTAILFAGAAFAQCTDSGSLFAAGATSTPVDNTVNLCSNWTFTVNTQLAVTSYTAVLQGNFGAGFVTMISCSTVPTCQTTITGSVPNTTRVILNAVNGGYVNFSYGGSVPKVPETKIIIPNNATTLGSDGQGNVIIGPSQVTINATPCTFALGCTLPASAPAIQFSQTNTQTVSGTTAETSLVGTGAGTVTLPANFFAAPGSILRVVAQFNFSGTANAAVFKTKLGGTQINAASMPSATVSTYTCSFVYVMTARTVGAGGTIMGNGMVDCYNTSSPGTFDFGFNILSVPVTINTTGTLAFDFTVTPGAAGQTYNMTNLVLTNY